METTELKNATALFGVILVVAIVAIHGAARHGPAGATLMYDAATGATFVDAGPGAVEASGVTVAEAPPGSVAALWGLHRGDRVTHWSYTKGDAPEQSYGADAVSAGHLRLWFAMARERDDIATVALGVHQADGWHTLTLPAAALRREAAP